MWADLEEALDRLPSLPLDGRTLALGTPARKRAAFATLAARLRGLPWEEASALVGRIADAAGVDTAERVDRLCLDWREIRALDGLDLCTIGAHTLTHPMLALQKERDAMAETGRSKQRLEEMLGHPVQHFAYPVGDALAAGPREFAIAAEDRIRDGGHDAAGRAVP